MRVTTKQVIQMASDLADEKGFQGVSLKAVSERLGIRTPSLYNHVEGIVDLLLEVAHMGMRAMNARMSEAATGKSGDNAIKSASIEYLNFVIEHPGVYETIQWATWHGSCETEEVFEEYTDILISLIDSLKLKSPREDEILRLLTSILHGYTNLQLQYAMKQPEEARKNLCTAVDAVLAGIRQKYN